MPVKPDLATDGPHKETKTAAAIKTVVKNDESRLKKVFMNNRDAPWLNGEKYIPISQ